MGRATMRAAARARATRRRVGACRRAPHEARRIALRGPRPSPNTPNREIYWGEHTHGSGDRVRYIVLPHTWPQAQRETAGTFPLAPSARSDVRRRSSSVVYVHTRCVRLYANVTVRNAVHTANTSRSSL